MHELMTPTQLNQIMKRLVEPNWDREAPRLIVLGGGNSPFQRKLEAVKVLFHSSCSKWLHLGCQFYMHCTDYGLLQVLVW